MGSPLTNFYHGENFLGEHNYKSTYITIGELSTDFKDIQKGNYFICTKIFVVLNQMVGIEKNSGLTQTFD